MPQALAMAVKNFMLSDANSKAYSSAMNRSGPIDNTAAYHRTAEPGAFFCMDDPKWQEFMARNAKREDQWRTPSALAWDHKPHGILGEVVDFERMRKEMESYASF